MWCPNVSQEPGSFGHVSHDGYRICGVIHPCDVMLPKWYGSSEKGGCEWPDSADAKALAWLTQQSPTTKPSCMGVLGEAQAWFKFSPCDVAHALKWRDGNGGVSHETWGHTATKIILSKSQQLLQDRPPMSCRCTEWCKVVCECFQ